MRSEDFDAFLDAGTLNGTIYSSSSTKDDGGGGLDAKLRATVGPSGRLVIRAMSFPHGEKEDDPTHRQVRNRGGTLATLAEG
jgi:hypothetical protein